MGARQKRRRQRFEPIFGADLQRQVVLRNRKNHILLAAASSGSRASNPVTSISMPRSNATNQCRSSTNPTRRIPASNSDASLWSILVHLVNPPVSGCAALNSSQKLENQLDRIRESPQCRPLSLSCSGSQARRQSAGAAMDRHDEIMPNIASILKAEISRRHYHRPFEFASQGALNKIPVERGSSRGDARSGLLDRDVWSQSRWLDPVLLVLR